MGWKDKAKVATLPETTEDIVTNGALLVEYDNLREQIDKYKTEHPNSLAGMGIAPIRERMAEIEQEMRDSVITVTLRAIPRSRKPGYDGPTWRELNEAHPPRVDEDGIMNPADRINGGVDMRTFPEAMLRASIVKLDEEASPFPRDSDWEDFAGMLTQGQADRLIALCWTLNRGTVSVPFYSAGSVKTEASGEK